MQLWTEKHKPRKTKEMVGQDMAIAEIMHFLDDWKPGQALLLYGPTGTGKTLLVELIARERGDFLVQLDASESMSRKNIEGMLSEAARQKTLFHHGKLILMDEVDCLSGRSDRGAAGGIVKIINQSKFPLILCVNNVQNPRLRQIKKHCKRVRFDKIQTSEIASFLKRIADKEGVKADDAVLKSLARWSAGDMRSAILDFQALAVGEKKITEEEFLSLGFRERRKGIEEALGALLRSGSLKANRSLIRTVDIDPDDIFWWIESNAFRTSDDPDFIAGAYDVLSKADVFRNRVRSQQNWRFKAYMIDLMSGIGTLRTGEFMEPERFRIPDRIIMLARTRFKRALLRPMLEKLGEHLHCSTRVVRRDHLPYLQFMLKKGETLPPEFELTPEEIEAIKKY